MVSVPVALYASNTPPTSKFACKAYPALRLVYLTGIVAPRSSSVFSSGKRYTMANLPAAYAPPSNVDIASSASGTIPIAASTWKDGQIVLSPKGGSIAASESITLSGIWSY